MFGKSRVLATAKMAILESQLDSGAVKLARVIEGVGPAGRGAFSFLTDQPFDWLAVIDLMRSIEFVVPGRSLWNSQCLIDRGRQVLG